MIDGQLALVVYAAGGLAGVWRTDGPPATRVAYGVLWPLGLLACVVTLTGLVLVAAVALGARALRSGPA